MYEKLVTKLNIFENVTAIIAGVCSVILFLFPTFTNIVWEATFPGAFIFLSLIGFILIRKQERKKEQE